MQMAILVFQGRPDVSLAKRLRDILQMLKQARLQQQSDELMLNRVILVCRAPEARRWSEEEREENNTMVHTGLSEADPSFRRISQQQ